MNYTLIIICTATINNKNKQGPDVDNASLSIAHNPDGLT